MSEEADARFNELFPDLLKLEKKYESIKDANPIKRGEVGKEILKLVDGADVATEYLRHCEHQVERTLTESQRSRIETVIRIIAARERSY